MTKVWSVWYDNEYDGIQLRAVFSTREKAERWIDREMEQDDLGMLDRDGFAIGVHYVDDEDCD